MEKQKFINSIIGSPISRDFNQVLLNGLFMLDKYGNTIITNKYNGFVQQRVYQDYINNVLHRQFVFSNYHESDVIYDCINHSHCKLYESVVISIC